MVSSVWALLIDALEMTCMAHSLRPASLDELIGQEPLKQKARVAIGAALARGDEHSASIC